MTILHRFLRDGRALVVLSTLLLGAACGGGGGGGDDTPPVPMGTLEVLNDCDSIASITAVDIEDSLGGITHYDLALDPCDWMSWDVPADDYEVRVTWSTADVFPYDETVTDGGYTQIQAVN